MNYKLGDKLMLNTDAFNVSTKEVLYKQGTEVEIVHIKNGIVDLKFPDNEVHRHNQFDIPLRFTNINSGKLLYNDISGHGTPPKALHKYLPKETDWRKNYIWRIHIELEERENKNIICPECTSELTKEINSNDVVLIDCDTCLKKVVPYNLKERDTV